MHIVGVFSELASIKPFYLCSLEGLNIVRQYKFAKKNFKGSCRGSPQIKALEKVRRKVSNKVKDDSFLKKIGSV